MSQHLPPHRSRRSPPSRCPLPPLSQPLSHPRPPTTHTTPTLAPTSSTPPALRLRLYNHSGSRRSPPSRLPLLPRLPHLSLGLFLRIPVRLPSPARSGFLLPPLYLFPLLFFFLRIPVRLPLPSLSAALCPYLCGRQHKRCVGARRVVATIGWPPVDRRVVDQRRVAVTGQHAAGAGQLPRGDDGYPPIINTRSPPAECSLDFFSPLSSLPPPPSSSASVIRLRGLPDCCRASTSASAPVSARLRHRASTSAPPISSRSRVRVRGDHSTASSRPSSRRATAGAAKARSRWAGAAAAPPPRSRTRASSSSTRSGHRPVAFVFAVPRIEHRIQPSLVDSGEGYITVDGNTGDRIRMNITLWHGGEALIAATAAACANTIVVQHVVGPMLVTD
ncbi:hypothetical protein B0H11DRAFT_2419056 [Mycena galericulata]|nr:hypothetical protein B0H11DRAFT_2419056 [Mycena galericulata]